MKISVFNKRTGGKMRTFFCVLLALVCSAPVLTGCGSSGTCTLTTNITPEGTGTVSRKPNKTSFAPGKKVTITAIPADGYKFVGWTVTEGQAQFADANSATTTITLGANPTATIVASFRLDQFNSKITYGSFNDPRDGQSYRTVKIGNVTWMAENLNFEMNDSKCGGVNAATGLQYGQLYMWSNRSACPPGWLLPMRQDWHGLIQATGGEQAAGRSLKSARGWQSGGNGTDEFGFSAIPEDNDGLNGSWWSTEESNAGLGFSNIYYVFINSNSNSMVEAAGIGGMRHIRCIQLDKEQMAARERQMEEERQREQQRLEGQRQQQLENQRLQRERQEENQRLAREREEQQRQQRLENQRLQKERQEQQRQQRLEEQRLQKEKREQQRQQRQPRR